MFSRHADVQQQWAEQWTTGNLQLNAELSLPAENKFIGGPTDVLIYILYIYIYIIVYIYIIIVIYYILLCKYIYNI